MRNRVPQKARRRSQTPSSRNKKLLLQLGFGAFLVCVVIALGYGVWYLTRLPAVTISAVVVEDGVTISADRIRSLVEEELNGVYLGIIPKRFTYMYPKTQIVETLVSEGRIKTASVRGVNRTELQIVFTEYTPHALWCEAEGVECIFLDIDGVAFEAAPTLSGGTFLRYQIADAPFVIGESPFTAEFIAVTGSFAALLEQEKRFVVSHVEQTKDGDIVYHLAGGAEIITGPDLTPQESFENLLTVLDAESFSHLEGTNFEYIDLRFGNKVYVREEDPSVATSTATSSAESATLLDE